MVLRRQGEDKFSRESETLDLSPGQRSPPGNQVHQVTAKGEEKDEMPLGGRGEQSRAHSTLREQAGEMSQGGGGGQGCAVSAQPRNRASPSSAKEALSHLLGSTRLFSEVRQEAGRLSFHLGP